MTARESLEIADDLQSFRTGRNWIRVGDVVKITRSREGKKDGYHAELKGLRQEAGVWYVEVFGAAGSLTPATRLLPLTRVERIEQSKAPRINKEGCVKPLPQRWKKRSRHS